MQHRLWHLRVGHVDTIIQCASVLREEAYQLLEGLWPATDWAYRASLHELVRGAFGTEYVPTRGGHGRLVLKPIEADPANEGHCEIARGP